MHGTRRKAADGGRQRVPVHLAARAMDGHEAAGAGEEFRRAAFVGRDMRLGMAESNATRLGDGGERQRIGGRAGADEEDGHLALEQVVEAFFHAAVEIARAVGRGIAGGFERQALGNLGVGAGPVV